MDILTDADAEQVSVGQLHLARYFPSAFLPSLGVASARPGRTICRYAHRRDDRSRPRDAVSHRTGRFGDGSAVAGRAFRGIARRKRFVV